MSIQNNRKKRILVLNFLSNSLYLLPLQGYNITFDKILSYLRDSLRDPKKVESNARRMSEDMRRVRLRQQEMTNKLAIQAAIVRKEKEEEEKKEKGRKKGQRLGDGGGDGSSGRRSDSSSYNPMQPWSSGSGSSYRPPRRTVNRGGG